MEITKAQKAKIEDLRDYFNWEAKSIGSKLTRFEYEPTKYFIDVRATIERPGGNLFTQSSYQVFVGKRGAVKRAIYNSFSNEINVTKLLNGNLYFLTRDMKRRSK